MQDFLIITEANGTVDIVGTFACNPKLDELHVNDFWINRNAFKPEAIEAKLEELNTISQKG